MQDFPQFGPAFSRAMMAFDARNAQDPNRVVFDGAQHAKELLYAQRMSDMLARYLPEASEALQLAVRCQHIERWTISRASYPMTRPGYHQWRKNLNAYHAQLAGELMQEAGYDEGMITRVAQLVSKHASLADIEMQALENVIVMVFVEYYLEEFVGQHPEYDVPKWKDILRKTLRKVSPEGHQGLLTKVNLPQALVPLIQEVMREEGWL